MLPKYKVTREFTSGILKGLFYTEITSVFFLVGFECKHPCGGGDPYIITSVEMV
jgi:hypothetical protein